MLFDLGGASSPCSSLTKALRMLFDWFVTGHVIGDLEGLHGGELADAVLVGPGGEAIGGVEIGIARVVVVVPRGRRPR